MNVWGNAMVKVSIIVPVYNVERYIGRCLDSLLNQTLPEIEILCVDDASTDTSLCILERKAIKDQRIKIIKHEENLGTSQARKHGVEQAIGEYLPFVDSDDTLELNACEELYTRMKKEEVDILHYGTNVIPAVELSQSMIKWVENFLEPYPQKITGDAILRNCFVDDKFDFNITDKMWSTKLCQKAFSQINTQKMIAAEDRYAFFILAYYANSYLGVSDAKYYNYYLGIGVTGGDVLDLQRFEKRCTGVMAVRGVETFLKEQLKFDKYQDEYHGFSDKILWDCVDCWIHKLTIEDSADGYKILLKYWEVNQIISAIARTNFEDVENIKDKTGLFKEKNQDIVGIYCREIRSEEECDFLTYEKNKLEQYGNKVIIFVDKDVKYKMEGAVLLPESEWANWDQYAKRAGELKKILTVCHVNMLLYLSVNSHIAWLDQLLIKSCGIPVIMMDLETNLSTLSEYMRKNRWRKRLHRFPFFKRIGDE